MLTRWTPFFQETCYIITEEVGHCRISPKDALLIATIPSVVYLLSCLMNPDTTTAAKRYKLSYHIGKVTILENAP